MKEMSGKAVITVTICAIIWLGTLITFFFVQNLVTLFLAIPHTLALLIGCYVLLKHIPAKTDEKKDADKYFDKRSQRGDKGITYEEMSFFDIIDDD